MKGEESISTRDSAAYISCVSTIVPGSVSAKYQHKIS